MNDDFEPYIRDYSAYDPETRRALEARDAAESEQVFWVAIACFAAALLLMLGGIAWHFIHRLF